MSKQETKHTILQQYRIAKLLTPIGGELSVWHNPEKDEPSNALAYFIAAGCPVAFIHYILKKDGTRKDFYRSKKNIYRQAPETLDERLGTSFGKIYSLANGSLDHIYSHGFNRHDGEHIDIVTDRTVALLKKAKQPRKVIRRGVLVARAHDLGNILSRKYHSFVSVRMLQQSVQQVTDDPAQWRIIRRGIQLHNEPVASALIRSFGMDLSEKEIIEKMRIHFGPEALAAIIADKTDVGRHRISKKAAGYDAVNEDQHLEVNLLGETDGLVFHSNDTVFEWSLSFRPGISEKEQNEYARFCYKSSSRNENVVFVSQKTHELHQKYNIPHFSTWNSLFWALYYDRIVLAVRSAFALYPTLTSFIIVAKDVESGSEKKYEFSLEKLDKQFAILKKMYIREKVQPNDKQV